jgi:hypothetical protein
MFCCYYHTLEFPFSGSCSPSVWSANNVTAIISCYCGICVLNRFIHSLVVRNHTAHPLSCSSINGLCQHWITAEKEYNWGGIQPSCDPVLSQIRSLPIFIPWILSHILVQTLYMNLNRLSLKFNVWLRICNLHSSQLVFSFNFRNVNPAWYSCFACRPWTCELKEKSSRNF